MRTPRDRWLPTCAGPAPARGGRTGSSPACPMGCVPSRTSTRACAAPGAVPCPAWRVRPAGDRGRESHAGCCHEQVPGARRHPGLPEEPIRDDTPEAYESLRTLTNVSFAIGEEFASKWQFLPYVERGIAQYARLDICNVGGFTEAVKVAGWCEAHYVDLMPHNPLGPICTAATVQLCAAIPNHSWLECRETSGERNTSQESPPLHRPAAP
ncbi:enolase C-terminal domain-like protein [Actinopolymorpha pittospori]|uniref:enolase C-terminal domain-like protein n=2 Tax=Actinopolymorpha pittospori TaxID=648752 RepID=UPI003B589762